MTKLDLKKAAVIPASTDAEMRSAFDIIEEVMARASEWGIEPYSKPATVPPDLSELGKDPDQLTNAELAALHLRYTAYAQFINTKLAEITAAHRIADNNLKHIIADLTNQFHVGKAVAKADVPHMVRAHSKYREYECEALKLYAMKTILDARYTSYDKQAAAISRIITVRQMELEATLRDSNKTKRRAAGSSLAGRTFRGSPSE